LFATKKYRKKLDGAIGLKLRNQRRFVMKTWKIFVVIAALLLVTTMPTFITSSSAHAAARSAKLAHPAIAAYDPNDPYDSGCSQGAYVAKHYDFKYGSQTIATLENWYSPKCVTNWAQIEWPGGSSVQTFIVISANSTTQCFPTDCNSSYTGGLSPSWTDMVDGHSTACAVGNVRYKNKTIVSPDLCA
jgi:hypothetical protein